MVGTGRGGGVVEPGTVVGTGQGRGVVEPGGGGGSIEAVESRSSEAVAANLVSSSAPGSVKTASSLGASSGVGIETEASRRRRRVGVVESASSSRRRRVGVVESVSSEAATASLVSSSAPAGARGCGCGWGSGCVVEEGGAEEGGARGGYGLRAVLRGAVSAAGAGHGAPQLRGAA